MDRILFFIPDLGKGGAERILVNIANKISQDYADKYCVMIALAQKEGYYVDLVNPRVSIIDLNTKRVSKSVLLLIKLIRRYHKDNLHFISFLGYANIFAIIAAYLSLCRSKVDLIVSERNHIPWGSGIKCTIVYLLQKVLYRKCNSIITIGDSISEEIEKKLHVAPQKLHTIYNPLTLGKISKLPDSSFDKNICNIITAGRLIPVKDFPLLIKAFAIINSKIQSKLWILGEGPEKEHLELETKTLGIQEHVKMCGFVDNPISYFQNADVYVCSSISEGFANVVLEAMAAGTRIVTMSCGGPDEILENGKWGTIVYERDPQKLADAILSSLDTVVPDYSERLKSFDINTIVAQYIDVLK